MAPVKPTSEVKMEFIKLLIVLVLLSASAEALVQDQRLIDAAKKEGGKVVIYAHPKHRLWMR